MASVIDSPPSRTAVQKLLARAAGRTHVEVGEVVYPEPDLVTIHDGFSEGAYRELSALGYRALRHPERIMFVTDHEVAYSSPAAVSRGTVIRDISKRWDIGHFFDVGRGGHGHLFPIENGMVRPGMVVFSYDMHCTTFGAVGALAFGVGPEVTTVLATGTLWTQVPATIRVDLVGRLPRGSHARDVGFVLTKGLAENRWAVDYDYRVIEFGGPGAETFDLAGRVALCNSVTELGIASVLFDVAPPDVERAQFAAFASDPHAAFEARIEIDLGQIEPQVALPGGPENAVPVGDAKGRPIQHAFIGSCGSGMYEDFADAAALLRGRRIADGVRMFIVPGSVQTAQRLAGDGLSQIFMEAGAMLLPSGCGPCANGLMAPLGTGEVSISTAAINHSGRFGAPGGEPYLGSPLTVAASALAGRIVDPRDYVDTI
ncbi:3-isopropylmalate dehydratase large subunit [Pararobbsia silviterrae]|nr:aconitase family protein [Pararobbsia silviterrae]